jgi:hypothetical protein
MNLNDMACMGCNAANAPGNGFNPDFSLPASIADESGFGRGACYLQGALIAPQINGP